MNEAPSEVKVSRENKTSMDAIDLPQVDHSEKHDQEGHSHWRS
jgi:hypothetical protein